MEQRLEHIVLGEHSLIVSLRVELLQLIDDLVLVHLLRLLPFHDVADVIDDASHLVLVSISVILFWKEATMLGKSWIF